MNAQIVKITHLGTEGDGYATTQDGQTIIVPFTAPEDLVEINAHPPDQSTKTPQKADILRIITPSPERTEPICPVFGECGGCQLQHLKPEAYAKYKNAALRHILNPVVNPETQFNDIDQKAPKHLRRRTTWQVSVNNKTVTIGYTAKASHTIVSIDQCPVLTSELNRLILPLKQTLQTLKKPGVIKRITATEIEETQNQNRTKIALNFEITAQLKQGDLEKLIAFAERNTLSQLTITSPNQETRRIWGQPPKITHNTAELELPDGAFLQASKTAETVMIAAIQKAIKSQNVTQNIILDLFCGTGTYSLNMTHFCNHIFALDLDQDMVTALANAARKTHQPAQIKTAARDLFKNPLKAQDMTPYTTAIINPPRAGALAQSRELAHSQIPLIVYISCNPKTFVRDAKILTTNGYTLDEVTPVDQFIYTPHLELVSIFRKDHPSSCAEIATHKNTQSTAK